MTVQKFKRHELFDGILSLVLAWIFLSFFSGVFLYEIAICFCSRCLEFAGKFRNTKTSFPNK